MSWEGMGSGVAFMGRTLHCLGFPYSDPQPIPNTMAEVDVAIFDNLNWLHEAYLDDPTSTIAVAGAYNLVRPALRSYA